MENKNYKDEQFDSFLTKTIILSSKRYFKKEINTNRKEQIIFDDQNYSAFIQGFFDSQNPNFESTIDLSLSVKEALKSLSAIEQSVIFLLFNEDLSQKEAAQILADNGVDALVVIGGDGSFTGAKLLSKLGVKTIGLPGTIDNDLTYTDYTIGFDTALNTVVDAIDKIRDTSTSHERVSIVEVMGRNCGDIALHTGVACGAEYIITPEKGYDKDELCKVILEGKKAGKMHNLVLLAEGVGGASELAKYIEAQTGIETRATVLGHIQRGGAPSAFDRVLASRMGSKAIELLMEGKTSKVVGIKNNQIFDQDIDEALALNRTFDEKLYEISEEISK